MSTVEHDVQRESYLDPSSLVPASSRLVLDDPFSTKGTAFTPEERTEHGLLGLLPAGVTTLPQQVERCWLEIRRQPDNLQKYVYLRSLQDRNEHLFYAVLAAHLDEAMPLVYTPTVAEGCQHFSTIWRRPRGLYVSYPDRHRLREVLANRRPSEVDVIVATDGQRILGIGDQGVGGMAISIGKLTLYSLIGGVNPSRTLPVLLDVGTDNPDLLSDPHYLGWRHPRISDEEYFGFVDQFVSAVTEAMPETLLQWEDLATDHALPVLQRYRDKLLTFNDDIQGTAAVTVGALHGAVNVAGTRLGDQHVVMLGAGSAGIGVMNLIANTMVDEGLTLGEARARCWIVNRGGLLTTDRTDLSDAQRVFAHDPSDIDTWTGQRPPQLLDVIDNLDAGVLLGLSTAPGAFTEEIVTTMAKKTPRPIIFPLSNPTSRSEATPEELMSWTEGRALVATGSPFPPVVTPDRTVHISQCNNVYVFPAIGLAIVASRASRVTHAMMRAAARALGAQSPALKDAAAPLLPRWEHIIEATNAIALAVATQAVTEGVAPHQTTDELEARIAAARWKPGYPTLAPRKTPR
jgi:malate dehydrogenase (oxaloacetate-decarboxylating)